MLTRRRKRVAVRPELAACALPPLPLPLVLAVASRLPVDDRMLLALVSPALRAVSHDTSLWLTADLSLSSGARRVTDALLLAVSARAAGDLLLLSLAGRLRFAGTPAPLSVAAVVAVCRSNPGLRHLNVRCGDELGEWGCLILDRVAQLLSAAPGLTRLTGQPSPSWSWPADANRL